MCMSGSPEVWLLLHLVSMHAHSEQAFLAKLAQLETELLAEQAHAAGLQAVIDSYDAQVLAPLAKRLTDAEDAQSRLQQQHQHVQDAQRQELRSLKQEQLQLLREHEQLLDALAQKEEQVWISQADCNSPPGDDTSQQSRLLC